MDIIGPIVGSGATAVIGVAAWAARQFVRSEARDPEEHRHSLTAIDLDAALARHEIRLLERFNGRYPSKEVFSAKMDAVAEQIAQTRAYIGDVERRMSERICPQRT